YLYERVIHVEVVLEVALIAVAQKVIVLDASRAGGTMLLGVAGVILALSVAFWAVRSARRSPAGAEIQ
ncbi:MAG TPA: phosphate-starvation-inducible PsiE family protein, partial [Labilithrix sp.]|nr:phosphate-starvation-inducible PsiE family protein [Labilithrix sp.]